jgi:acyl carrier protein
MVEGVDPALRKIFEGVFGRPMPQLARETGPSHVDGWNSMRHAFLIMEIESHFGIEVPEDKYAALETVGDFADFIAAAGRPRRG